MTPARAWVLPPATRIHLPQCDDSRPRLGPTLADLRRCRPREQRGGVLSGADGRSVAVETYAERVNVTP